MTQVPNNSDALWLKKKKAKRDKRRNRVEDKPGLLINSLMDAFTIILCFLLKSFGSDPVMIKESDDMKLPTTTSKTELEAAVVIGISKKSIQVDNEKAADIINGVVDESQKEDGADGLIINPLLTMLQEKVTHLRLIAQQTGSEFKAMALVVADKKTNYRLITEVLYTAGRAEFTKFKFVGAEGRHD